MILIDTDIIVDYLRNYPPAVQWIESQEEEILISGYSCLELIDGCINSKSLNKLTSTLSLFTNVWSNQISNDFAVDTFSKLKLKTGIDFVDCLIGHTAVEINLPLYTFNKKHYKHIPKLKTIQPYKK